MRAVLLLTAAALTGCAPEPVAQAKPNCAARPVDFLDVRIDGWPGDGRDIVPPPQETIRIDRRSGAPSWNDVPLGGTVDADPWAVLDTYLMQTAELMPTPYVTLIFDRGTPCTAVQRVRALMRQRLGCGRSGHCYQGSLDRHVG